ncbi:hypothetical protein A9513_018880 [Pseudomonas sp. AU12215]|nr:hypothetical protein A9513_018880 [Pseudomonas sp. AU12215]
MKALDIGTRTKARVNILWFFAAQPMAHQSRQCLRRTSALGELSSQELTEAIYCMRCETLNLAHYSFDMERSNFLVAKTTIIG